MRTGDKFSFTRRRFLSVMGWLAVMPIAGLWGSMVHRMKVRETGKIFTIKIEDVPEGLSVHDKYAINRVEDSIKVFSSKCSHLGCRIRAGENYQLVCPCHGSEFDGRTGAVLKGPAAVPLEQVEYKIENDLVSIYTD